MSPFVPPEIADTPLDAKSKPALTTAVDIWSLGVLAFNCKTDCLPMSRDNQNPDPTKRPKFDPDAIINSEQYEKIFDEDLRNFLVEALQPDPTKRATAQQLLSHKWIVKNEEERQRQFNEAKEVRLNFAKQVKVNYLNLMSMSEFELDLMRALYSQGILDDRGDQIEALFDACDIEGGPDGSLSFVEVKMALRNTGVFIDQVQPGQKLQEGDVTLEDLDKALERVDISADGKLDPAEFMFLALDRSLIFSKENLEALFFAWVGNNIERPNVFHHLIQMIGDDDD